MDLLDDYRLEINRIDREITKLFEQRMNISKKIANYKINNNLEIYQKDREEKVIDKNISYLEEKRVCSIVKKFLYKFNVLK
ncbi:chorismate mutase [Romboutsia sp. Marseille-P6047]|uniref:chorismate mutase n=1 Tax=Romboutsia sp. Marseille-P6047 TaxID=2161817 RepID=UPI002ED5BA04